MVAHAGTAVRRGGGCSRNSWSLTVVLRRRSPSADLNGRGGGLEELGSVRRRAVRWASLLDSSGALITVVEARV